MKSVSAEVFAKGLLIGRAELRPLDPIMGIYGGRFAPDFAYSTVGPTIRRFMECAMDHSVDQMTLRSAFHERDQLKLEVRSDSGLVFHPSAVHIQDATRWIPDAPLEVHLLGLPQQEAEAAFGTS